MDANYYQDPYQITRFTYRMRQFYDEKFAYKDLQEFKRRQALLASKPMDIYANYMPASVKEGRLYYRLKYTTNGPLLHLYEAFCKNAKKYFNFKSDPQLEDALTKLLSNPENYDKYKQLTKDEQKDIMFHVEQIKQKQNDIMTVECKIPKEFKGEEKEEEKKDRKEYKIVVEKKMLERPKIKTFTVVASRMPKKEEKESKVQDKHPEDIKEKSQTTKKIEDYMLPVRTEEKKENASNESILKKILDKHYPPMQETLQMIYRILDMITSSSTSEGQLQAELFDLLGLDQMDFLQALITNRDQIKKDALKAMKSYGIKSGKGYDENAILTVLHAMGVSVIGVEENKKKSVFTAGSGSSSKAKPFEGIEKEVTISSGLYSGDCERFESKEYITQRFKEVPKNEHKEIARIPLSTFPSWSHPAFKDMAELNPIQSSVYETAFLGNNNMLICAPTGSGKTNIALMTILRELGLHRPEMMDFSRQVFTIIYVTPMKALASEIVEKFTKMLSYLKVNVRECTGDMQLSRSEITESHILVCTPEKLDVITRKSDYLLGQTKLLILDEIHLLNEERGAVLECLVIRTFNHITRKQLPVRIVGLSATMPNYIDISRFLHAEKGTFYFDGSFRPVPLSYEFVGIKEQANELRQKSISNYVCYELIKKTLLKEKQILIFVHSRAETVNLGEEILLMIKADQERGKAIFNKANKVPELQKEVQRSTNKPLQKLFEFGIGIHNAGMLRKDRNLSEKLFLHGGTRILISTSTLAWGVNLPAYCVCIKGTEYYNPSEGKNVDIGLLDIQQIFGRAGRPQFDNKGEAIIISTESKIQQFIGLLMNQTPIESHLLSVLSDAINAEVANGTITSVAEAKDWLKQSYLEQRIGKNPQNYGCNLNEVINDPSHDEIYDFFIKENARQLKKEGLIQYNADSRSMLSNDIGKIAANYYILHGTAASFSDNLRSEITEAELLKLLAESEEFKNILPRKDELPELQEIRNWCQIVRLKEGEELEGSAKILMLIEAYLLQKPLVTFSLIADTNYIMQSVIRLMRGMFEISLKNKIYENAKLCLKWAIRLEKRMVEGQCLARQFSYHASVNPTTYQKYTTGAGFIREDILRIMEENPENFSIEDIFNEDKTFVMRSLGSPAIFDQLMQYMIHLPRIQIQVDAQPMTKTILRINLCIRSLFKWSDKWNKGAESYIIMVDDTNNFILYDQQFTILKKEYMNNRTHEYYVSFHLPFPRNVKETRMYHITVCSDTWEGVGDTAILDLENIVLPEDEYPHTSIDKQKPLLPVTALDNPEYEKLYENFTHFNKVQTHVFNKLYKSDENVLVGAPTGSGKTIIGELAILRSFSTRPREKVIYIAPMKALTKERLNDWTKRLPKILHKSVVELTGDFTPDMESLRSADLVVTTPEKWDGISRHWEHREYVQKVSLMIIDEIHLLGQERGPVLEVIVTRMRAVAEKNNKSIRIIGLSTALANALDVADWLAVKQSGLFNFAHSERPVQIKVQVEGFSEKAYCPRMATMNKPAYATIKQYSEGKPVLVFVSSRRQTRLTSIDFISFSVAEDQMRKPFLKMKEEEMSLYLERVKDEHLRHALLYGIGLHHAGLAESDRRIVEELFVSRKIQICVTTSTLAWGVNFPAKLVIVKGTEYYDHKTKKYVDFPMTDLLQMIGRAGRPQFDTEGFAQIMVSKSQKMVLQEKKDFYQKFMYEPFPVESRLPQHLHDHINAEISSGTITNIQDCINYLNKTYFVKRLIKNPKYYGFLGNSKSSDEVNKYLADMASTVITDLQKANCVTIEDQISFETTDLGNTSSFYYLSYKTVSLFNEKIKLDPDTGKTPLLQKIIELLGNASEFDGLPVRHMEDSLNQHLYDICPLKIENHNMQDPHAKATLLILCYFMDIPFPVTDFITDSKTVLDSSIRILQGMIDIAKNCKLLHYTMKLINIMQMVVQALWISDPPLLQLPRQVFTSRRIAQLHSNYSIKYLPSLFSKHCQDVILSKVFSGDHIAKEKAITEIRKLPNIEFNVQVHTKSDKEGLELAEGEVLVSVNLKKLTGEKRIITKFGKIKQPSYYLLIGEEKSGMLIKFLRINLKRELKVRFTIVWPKFLTSGSIRIYLMHDSFIGMDQVINLEPSGAEKLQEMSKDYKLVDEDDDEVDEDGEVREVREAIEKEEPEENGAMLEKELDFLGF